MKPDRTIDYIVDEGTWINVDVSPDGTTLIFDLLGDIYTLPIVGGRARPLLQTRAWHTSPRYSPDGKTIAFIGDDDGGTRQLWVMPAEGGRMRRVTDLGLHDVVGFTWMRDGRLVVEQAVLGEPKENQLFHVDPNVDVAVNMLGQATSAATGVAAGSHQHMLLFAQNANPEERTTFINLDIHRFDFANGEKSLQVRNGFAPRLSRDGKRLAFVRAEKGKGALWIADLATGRERMIIDQIGKPRIWNRDGWHMATAQGLVPTYAFAPDGNSIFLSSHGKLWRVDIANGERTLIPFSAHVRKQIATPQPTSNSIGSSFTAKQLRWFDMEATGKKMAFSAAGQVWIGDGTDWTAHRLTEGNDREFEPALSPNGRSVAYITWSDTGPSRLMLAPLAVSGRTPPISLTTGEFLSQPSWSPDGHSIAFTSIRSLSCVPRLMLPEEAQRLCKMTRGDRGINQAEIVKLMLETGEQQVLDISFIPNFRFDKTARVHNATVFSSDGSSLFYSAYDPGNESGLTLYRYDLRRHIRSIHVRLGNIAKFDFAIPSPDGARLAIAANEGMWIFDLPPHRQEIFTLDFLHPQQGLRRIGPHGTHADWSEDGTLVWAFGNQIWRWDAEASSARALGQMKVVIDRVAPKGSIALTNATVISMKDEAVIKDATILIQGSRIRAIGAAKDIAIPSGAEVIDIAGKTIVPGLIDTHAHPLWNCCKRDYSYDATEGYLQALSAGVTTIMDPHADNQTAAFTQAEMVAAGRMLGPRIYSSGTGVFGLHNRSQNWAQETGDVGGLCTIVRQRAANGATWIKSYSINRRDWRQALVRCARAYGLRITTEGGARQNEQLTHYMDGHTSTEHNFPIGPLYRDVTQFIAQSGIFYTPVTPLLYGGQWGQRYFNSRSGLLSSSLRYRRYMRKSAWHHAAEGDYLPDSEQTIYDVARSVQAIVAQGGKLALGSHSRPDGLGLHYDMWSLQLGGIAPFQLLRAGTLGGAQKLGLEKDLGTLETGKIADLLVLNCNPLGNIRCTADIQYVMQAGFLYDAASLTQLFPSYKPLPKPHWITREDWKIIAPRRPTPLNANTSKDSKLEMIQ